MSATYDVYKEEALRLLLKPDLVVANVRRYIEGLKCPYSMVGCAKCETVNEAHHDERDRWAMTVAGHAILVYNHRSPPWTSKRGDKHNKWLARKLKEFGTDLGSSRTLVSTCNGTVYFSYHLIVHRDSHLPDS